MQSILPAKCKLPLSFFLLFIVFLYFSVVSEIHSVYKVHHATLKLSQSNLIDKYILLETMEIYRFELSKKIYSYQASVQKILWLDKLRRKKSNTDKIIANIYIFVVRKDILNEFVNRKKASGSNDIAKMCAVKSN